MFTIKLVGRTELKDGATGERLMWLEKQRLVSADIVNVYTLRHGELFEVAGESKDGTSCSFYVANQDLPRPYGFADSVDMWDRAYIENASGKTTRVVNFN